MIKQIFNSDIAQWHVWFPKKPYLAHIDYNTIELERNFSVNYFSTIKAIMSNIDLIA